MDDIIESHVEPEAAEPAVQHRLTPKRAILIFIAFLVSQLLGSIIVIVTSVIAYKITHPATHMSVIRLIGNSLIIPSAAFGMLLSGAVTFWLAKRSCPGALPDALAPIGWTKSSTRQVLVGALLGVTIVFIYLYVVAPLFPRTPGHKIGPLARLMSTGGWNRHGLALLAVLLAPPVEELMFRGVLFAGFCRSWPLIPSGFLATMLFLVCHLMDVIYYGPAIFAVSATGAALWFMRAKTGSLLPPMALHAAYNFSLFVFVYAWSR